MAKHSKKHTAGSAKKQKKRVVTTGIVHINATYNNTLISVTDLSGNVLGFSSSGKFFKGSRKSTPYAAQVAGKDVAEQMRTFGMTAVHARITGVGTGRDSALRGITAFSGASVASDSDVAGSDRGDTSSDGGGRAAGGTVSLRLLSIEDITPQPHNGCRAKKKRRI